MTRTITLFSLITALVCLAAPAEAKKPPPLSADEVIHVMSGQWSGSGTEERWTVTASNYEIVLVSTGVAVHFDEQTRHTATYRYRQTLKTRVEPDRNQVYAPQAYLAFVETGFEVTDIIDGGLSAAQLRADWQPMQCTMSLVADRAASYTPVLHGGCITLDAAKQKILWRVDWRGKKVGK